MLETGSSIHSGWDWGTRLFMVEPKGTLETPKACSAFWKRPSKNTGRLCTHFYPFIFYSFIPMIFTYYSFQCPLFSIMLMVLHIIMMMMKVVTMILPISWSVVVSNITESCMLSSKEDSCCKHKKLVTGNEAAVDLVKSESKFAMFWPPDQESVSINSWCSEAPIIPPKLC